MISDDAAGTNAASPRPTPTRATKKLQKLPASPQPTVANDPIYAGTRLNCQGQIRFGTAGQATAAAVWLVAPCTELFNDNRADDSVDLAVGTDFGTLAHTDDIDAVLASLRPGATEPSDPMLLQKIHASSC